MDNQPLCLYCHRTTPVGMNPVSCAQGHPHRAHAICYAQSNDKTACTFTPAAVSGYTSAQRQERVAQLAFWLDLAQTLAPELSFWDLLQAAAWETQVGRLARGWLDDARLIVGLQKAVREVYSTSAEVAMDN